MGKTGTAGLILVAIMMVAIGSVLRWELIDWLIDLIGFMFIGGGVVVGVVALVRLLSGGGNLEAASFYQPVATRDPAP